MPSSEKTITINAIINIRTDSLESIVKNEKEAAGFGSPGSGPVDTAGKVGELISRFLIEKDFDRFAKDPANYSGKKQEI